MASPETFNGFDLRRLPDAFYDNPFPFYHRMRRDTPVRRMPDGSILLTRHADLDRIYRDTKTFSSDKKIEFKPKFGDSLLYEHHTTSLVFSDPPLHTRVRRAIVGALAPRALNPLEPQVERIVDRLISDIEPGSEFDAVEQFAMHLPIEIIGDLLCVPREEREPLRGWSLAILGALEPEIPREKFDRGNRAVEEFLVYLKELVSRRRAEMTSSEDDILSRLIRDVDAEDGLMYEELLHSCVFILNAGHETTTNLIGNGIAALLDFRGEVQRLRENPDMMDSASEEFLRFESSNQLGNRRVTVETRIGDEVLAPGTVIHLGIGAANRDPAIFHDLHDTRPGAGEPGWGRLIPGYHT